MQTQAERDKFYTDLRCVVHNCLKGEVRKAVHVILMSDIAAPRVITFSASPSKPPTHPDLIELEMGLRKIANYLRPLAQDPYDWVSGRILNRANFYIGMIEDMQGGMKNDSNPEHPEE